MKTKLDTKTEKSGPTDKTLDAYQRWIQELVIRFTTDGLEVMLTDEQWRATWKEYWRDQNKKSDGSWSYNFTSENPDYSISR